ncbi:hypothetical protein [Paracoccus versutus]
MPFNPSGVFQRLYRWVTDRDNSIPIDSTRMDAEIDGMVTGINAIVSQTQAFTGPVKSPAGTALTPGHSFGNDPDTGMYRSGANTIGFSAGGSNVFSIGPTQIVASQPVQMAEILTITGGSADKIRLYNTVFSGSLYGLIRIADDGRMLLSSPLSGSTPYYLTSSSDTPSNVWDLMTLGMSNARYMPQTWTLTAGNGLTGGGNGSDNRAVALGTPSTVGASTANAVTTGSHTHAIGADIARSAITISPGNGLTGGGNLTANRTLNMGTPSSITADSTNSASGNTHTHAISAATIGELVSRLSVGAVGTYAMLADINTSADLNPGATRAGSNLRYASAGGQTFGSAPAGTWQLCGFTPGGGSSHEQRATVWMRVS